MTGSTAPSERAPSPAPGWCVWRVRRRALLGMLYAIGLICWATASSAHKLGHSYLDLVSDKRAANVFYGEWFISVRDVGEVFHIGNGGAVTFEALKPHFGQIARYAYARLHFGDGQHVCKRHPLREEEVNRELGKEYVVLFFKVVCPASEVATLHIDNELFFDLDPTHVGILVFRDHGDTDTAFFSSSNRKIKMSLSKKRNPN